MDQPSDPAADQHVTADEPDPVAPTRLERRSPEVPISRARIKDCLDSARFWVGELPRYADREQKWADVLAIAAALISAITGLSIWPLLENGSDLGKVIYSSGAVFAAMLVALPRILNNGEMAGQARELASRYGGVLGDLEDLDEAAGKFDQSAALAVVTEFEATKQKKDALRRIPDRERVQIRRRGELSRMERTRAR